VENENMSTALRQDGFIIDCEAGQKGRFRANTSSAWIKVGQRVQRGAALELFDSVSVECTEDQDGTLIVRVIVFNPDWDEPLQIASMRSRPHDPDSLSALGCNLNHVTI
jgi:hypothetical protein